MARNIQDERGLLQALLGDGRPFLTFIGLGLILSGGFALFLSANHHFLPHDVQFLGMSAEQLCGINSCRIVYFMFHDRVAFGGALIALGAIYMWLAEFPLRQGEAWAWWVFVISGLSGFGSFLAYLGYGYLDTWHGVGTLLLLPFFIIGLLRSHPFLKRPRGIRSLVTPATRVSWLSSYGLGRALLLATAAGMVAGGLTVMAVGMTWVFVPQDLEFMGLQPAQLQSISSRLLFCVWCARPSRSLWQILCFSGLVGFAAAIGVHPVVGYTNLFHLAPAIVGVVIFVVGLVLTYKPLHEQSGKALR